MSKKEKIVHNHPINLPRRLREGLEDADDLLTKKEPQRALETLRELNKKFPHQPDVLSLLANAYLDSGDKHGYLYTIYQLHDLTPNRAEIKLGLAGAYLTNGYPALALHTFRQFLKQWPRDSRTSDAQTIIPSLEEKLTEDLKQLDFSLETGFEFICQHEEMRLNLEQGNFLRCRKLAKALILQRPNFTPVLNNLSQVEWLEGNLAKAVETGLKVLEIEPGNVHALSNLTRLVYMQGKKEEANAYALRLKETGTKATDRWVKKAEALCFIGDDEGVLALLEQAKRAIEQDELSATFWHWYAVAEYRNGSATRARRYWQKCLKQAPNFKLASVNLAEMQKPVAERICPQAFEINAWFPRRLFADMLIAAGQTGNQKNDNLFKVKINAFLDNHPELINFIPDALASGDKESRIFALNFTKMTGHPRLVEILKDFTLGQKGPDDLRLDTSQILTKQGIFKSGEKIKLWLDGEWKSILLFGFQISYEAPEQSPLKPAAQRLMEQAISALREGDGTKAEFHLRKALEIQKRDEPSILNNLALALGLQGKQAEADAITDEIIARFPDYFFGQIIVARKAILTKQLEKAKIILDKLMQQTELHVTEFGALCVSQIELMLEYKKPDEALTWYEIWKQGYPDDPQLEKFGEQMEMIKMFLGVKKSFFQSRRKKKRVDQIAEKS